MEDDTHVYLLSLLRSRHGIYCLTLSNFFVSVYRSYRVFIPIYISLIMSCKRENLTSKASSCTSLRLGRERRVGSVSLKSGGKILR